MLQDTNTQNTFLLLGNLVFVMDKAKVQNHVFFSYFGVSSFQQEMNPLRCLQERKLLENSTGS